MVNYVLSFCKITGASRIFSRNFYLPLLKPLTPKEALRTFRITGKWLLGAKIQHYMPVLLNHKKKRSKRVQNYGSKHHEDMEDYTYMTPVFDSDNEAHKLLLGGEDLGDGGMFVYTVHDKKYNIVLQAQLEKAILNGEVIDVLVSQKNDKIIVKLKNLKKVPLEIHYYDGVSELMCGEGATTVEDEKFHHHGQYTMGLAKIFEDKEEIEEKWEEELRRIMRKRRRQAKEGTKEWKEMYKESIKNLDWKKFEDEAKKIIEEIDEPVEEHEIQMEIDNLEATKNVNEAILANNLPLPTMKEIPDIIKNMGSATLHDLDTTKVSGVKVTLSSGKECFVSGQMVHTEDGDVFVPGQTIENEHGFEYAPGITITIDNKPTLINGLIMGEEERSPMFLPTQSTITSDGQLTFAAIPEERPKPKPKTSSPEVEVIQDVDLEEIDNSSEDSGESIELNTSEIEELDIEAMRLKQEEQRLEMEKLKQILLDDGMDDILASIEEKRLKLHQKLEELRRLNHTTEHNLVTYASDSETQEIAAKITTNKETINRLSDILMTMTRRAATFRDKNSIIADNINHACIPVSNLTGADVKFSEASNKLKMMLKTMLVAANDVFKTRPKDEVLALNAMGEILAEVLTNDSSLTESLILLMNTTSQRNDLSNAIFKQLTQNIPEAKVTLLNELIKNNNHDPLEKIAKIMKKTDETKSEAFIKIAKIEPELTSTLIEGLKSVQIKTEQEALEVLQAGITETTKIVIKNKLKELLAKNDEFLKEETIAFAKALGMTRVEEKLQENGRITDKPTVELLERVVLIRLLAGRDYSLKSALERIKKNPERGRSDPRIRQLIRESAVLLSRGIPLRNSRDIPVHLLKTQNLLAIEDYLTQRNVEFPVLVTRNNYQAVIPKEAARGVLAGRVAYNLIDESGVTSFKPMHMFSAISVNKNREKRLDDYLNGGRDLDDKKYLEAKSNDSKSSWNNPSSSRTMSSANLYRGYTGPRA